MGTLAVGRKTLYGIKRVPQCSHKGSTVVVDSYIQRIVLATEETTVTQQVSHRPITSSPACGHKEVPRSTGHIVVRTRYSDQQGSKLRQNVMRIYKQWHRPKSKRFIKPFYSISRAASIDLDCCRLPTTSVLSKAYSLEHKKCYNIVIGKDKYIYILQQVRRDFLLRV